MKIANFLFLPIFLTLTTMLFAQQPKIYVSDAGNLEDGGPYQILSYDLDGSNPQIFISNAVFQSLGVGWPQDILFLEGQNVVLISNFVGSKITRHDANTGAYIDDFASIIGAPTRMKLGADNLIYVVTWGGNGKLLRFQLDGTLESEFTKASVPQCVGFDWDSQGNLYLASYSNGNVRKFDSNGNDLGIFINAHLGGPTNIWFDKDDNLYVCDWNFGDVEKFGPSGNYLGKFINGIAEVEGLAFLSNGNILFGNGVQGRIDQYQPDGTFVESTIRSGSGGLKQPNAVVIREAVSSVNDFSQSMTFLRPTIGSTFYINLTELEVREPFKVYNIYGNQVGSISIKEGIWNSSNLSEGVYFIVAIVEGVPAAQKIIVKRN
jgi:DNA-binding beta-propeller fold protein YncE